MFREPYRQSAITWKVLTALSVSSGKWVKSRGSGGAAFCDALRDDLGGCAASGVDALSLRGFLSSGDMLDARELALLASALEVVLAAAFLVSALAVPGSSSGLTVFIFFAIACSSSPIKVSVTGPRAAGTSGGRVAERKQAFPDQDVGPQGRELAMGRAVLSALAGEQASIRFRENEPCRLR
jgi:hypothetical protein